MNSDFSVARGSVTYLGNSLPPPAGESPTESLVSMVPTPDPINPAQDKQQLLTPKSLTAVPGHQGGGG
jgi:hypothetical protein